MKALMSWIITIGFFICGIIAVLALSIPKEAKASDRSEPTNPGTPTVYSTSSSKNTIEPQAVFFGIIAVGTTAVCAYKRWWENDPCIGKAKPIKTSTADDTITPGNLSDKSDDGAIYIFKGR